MIITREKIQQAQNKEPFGEGEQKYVFELSDGKLSQEQNGFIGKFFDWINQVDNEQPVDLLLCVFKGNYYNREERGAVLAKSLYYFSKLGQHLGLDLPHIYFAGLVDGHITLIVEKIKGTQPGEKEIENSKLVQQFRKLKIHYDKYPKNFIKHGRAMYYLDYPPYIFGVIDIFVFPKIIRELPDDERKKSTNIFGKIKSVLF